MARSDYRIALEGLADDDLSDVPVERLVQVIGALKSRLLENEEIIDQLNLTVRALVATFEEHGSWDAEYYQRSIASHDILDGKYDGKLGSERINLDD